jgi:actin-related protein 8
MPRGIPNPKKDDFGMRYTSMHVPLAYVGYVLCKTELTNMLRPNPKHMGTTYLKSESQTIWARNAARKQKMAAEDDTPTPPDQR